MPDKVDVEKGGRGHGGDEDIATVDPKVLASLQSKLLTQAMTRDGSSPAMFIKSLPDSVQRRVKALKKLQSEAAQVESKFYKECHELEVKYRQELTEFDEKRRKVVIGEQEPTDAESDWPYDVEDELEEEEKENGTDEAEKPECDKKEDNVKGIPDFWYQVLTKCESVSILIQEHDEPILKHLTDIRLELRGGEAPGFTLYFHFEPNDYFSNPILTKEYSIKLDPSEGAESLDYDGPEIVASKGCGIEWKEGKDVTHKVVKKKQRNKKSGQVREVKSTQPAESFFRFFSPPEVSGKFEDMDEETQEELSSDFELGQMIREQIIPKAVMYFTGEAVDDDWDEDSEGDDDDLGDPDDDDEDDDDDDE